MTAPTPKSKAKSRRIIAASMPRWTHMALFALGFEASVIAAMTLVVVALRSQA